MHILPICFDSAQVLHIYHPQIEPQELYFTGHRHFHAIHTQLVIDNAGYIYYAEVWMLGHQNNAKQFTMMQQICANGPLHFPEECVILAEYIYRKCIDNMIFKVHFIIAISPFNLSVCICLHLFFLLLFK
jgi:hypothetical protein